MKTKLDNCPICPTCKHQLDGFTDTNNQGATPSPKDASVCLYCAELLEFDDDLELVYVTAETMEAVGDILRGARQTVLRIIEARGHKAEKH